MPYHTTTKSVALLEEELELRQDLAKMDYDELIEMTVKNHFQYDKPLAAVCRRNEEFEKEVRDLKKQIKVVHAVPLDEDLDREIDEIFDAIVIK